jgi:hypothetical protein
MGAGALGEGELAVVDIDGDDGGAMEGGSGDGAEADGSAAQDHHLIGGRDAAAASGVVADGERLNEAKISQLQAFGDDQLLVRNGDVVRHRAIALHAQRLVVFARIRTVAQAGGAFAAVGIGRECDSQAGLIFFRNAFAHGFNGGSDFVTRDAGIGDERILATEAAEVRPAHADKAHSQ